MTPQVKPKNPLASSKGSKAATPTETKSKINLAKSQGPATTITEQSKAILVQEEPEHDVKPNFSLSHAAYSRPERERDDDPMSLHELQASLGYKNVAKLRIPEREREESFKRTDLRENAMSNLPASMRRVKEEIKKKIEE